MFLLLACNADDRAERFDVVFAAPESDCAEEAVPEAREVYDVRFRQSDGEFSAAGIDDRCVGSGDAFTCDLDEWSGALDYAPFGVDAFVTQNLALYGTWPTGGVPSGSLMWETACEGTNCDQIRGSAPPLCTTLWTWKADDEYNRLEYRDDGDGIPSPDGIHGVGSAAWSPFNAFWSPDYSFYPVVTDEHGFAPLQPFLVPGFVDAEAHLLQTVGEPSGSVRTIRGGWIVANSPVWEPDSRDRSIGSVWATAESLMASSGGSWGMTGHGRDPEFVATDAVGRWDLSLDLSLANGHQNVSLFSSYLGPLYLEILAVAVGRAEFRLLGTSGGTDDECVVLHDEGSLSETGELTWSRDKIVVPTSDGPVPVNNASLRIGFMHGEGDIASDDAQGGEAFANVDFRELAGTDHDVCDLAPSFGVSCIPCDSDANSSCIALATFAGAERSEDPIGADLPLCGTDFSDTGVVTNPFDSCGGSGGGALCANVFFFLTVPAFLRARRSTDPRQRRHRGFPDLRQHQVPP